MLYCDKRKQLWNLLGDLIHPYPTHGAALQRTADQYWSNKLFTGIIPKILKRYIEWFR
jgi:hypothetical protein